MSLIILRRALVVVDHHEGAGVGKGKVEKMEKVKETFISMKNNLDI